MASDDSHDEDGQSVTVVNVMRLPCGHIVDEPARAATIVCPYDKRVWNVWHKGAELLAREES